MHDFCYILLHYHASYECLTGPKAIKRFFAQPENRVVKPTRALTTTKDSKVAFVRQSNIMKHDSEQLHNALQRLSLMMVSC